MEKLLIKGGNKLKGDVSISGAKNAAVAILPACLLVKGICRIENLPDIKDVLLYLRILEKLGAVINKTDNNTVEIDCTNVKSFEPQSELTRRMRGSSYLMGALLGRFHHFRVDPPGGCDFGNYFENGSVNQFAIVLGLRVSKGVPFHTMKRIYRDMMRIQLLGMATLLHFIPRSYVIKRIPNVAAN